MILVVIKTIPVGWKLALPDRLLPLRESRTSLEVLEPQLGGSTPRMALLCKTIA